MTGKNNNYKRELTMTYTVAICNASLPKDFGEADDLFSLLVDEPEPHPEIFHTLIDRLTARYPCICDIPDDDESSPWSDGPLRQESYTRATVLGMVFPKVDETMPFVIETATGLGLTILDWQTGLIHRPKR